MVTVFAQTQRLLVSFAYYTDEVDVAARVRAGVFGPWFNPQPVNATPGTRHINEVDDE